MAFLGKILLIFVAVFLAIPVRGQETVTISSSDGLVCTADLYLAKTDKHTPFLVLFHQAESSRGEYREIAPQLNALGYNCLALDARSGGSWAKLPNLTNLKASDLKLATGYTDAMPDFLAAVQYARQHWAEGKLIIWGSSYSAALVLVLGSEHPKLVDGILAFSPGEYFVPQQAHDWIEEAASKLNAMPVFITSGPMEERQWRRIFQAIPSPAKVSYVSEEIFQAHGSSCLWVTRPDGNPNPYAPGYWKAVKAFLGNYFPPR